MPLGTFLSPPALSSSAALVGTALLLPLSRQFSLCPFWAGLTGTCSALDVGLC